MIVFIKSNYRKAGIGRFLESLSLFDIDIINIDKIEDTNNYESEKAIFGGFLPEELIKVTSVKEKYYTYCSPFGQADLSSNDFYSIEIKILYNLKVLINDGVIKNAITQSKSLSNRFGYIYIPPVKIINKKDIHFTKDRKNCGFLGNNYRKHKNIANQLAAISILEPKELIVVDNASKYVPWEFLFDCKFISKDIKSDKDYYKEISTHRLCFQCSYSEAFDYQAFEYCMMGVPVIVGPCIDWIPNKPILRVANIDDPIEIRNKAQFLLDNEKKYWEVSEEVVKIVKDINNTNKNKLEEIIKGMLK